MNGLKPWKTAPERYHALFADKADRVEAMLRAFDPPTAERFASPPEGYRARAEFRLWHDGDDLFYAMFDPETPREPVRVKDFPAALPVIREAMHGLLARLRDSQTLRRKLFQAEFMGSTGGELLLTLAYHRPLDDDWEAAAQALAGEFSASVVGRSRRQKRVIGREYLRESFEVQGRRYRYRQYEQAFAQPNAPVNEEMLNWACTQVANAGHDLLELYCGNGNFTLPLSRHFNAVIATELSKSGTRAALENLEDNGIGNVSVVRLSAEEVSQAMGGVRVFRRLACLPRPLDDYALDTVFVDPPRAGLDAATRDCVQRIPRILYISCNPDTLSRDLEQLTATHRINAFALFDQFPYTPHMECGMVLVRR